MDKSSSPYQHNERTDRATPRGKAPGSGKRPYWIVYLAGILLAGLIFNQYLAWNQDLYIVNGFAEELTISIDGGDPITIPPQQHAKTDISEGDHTAVASRGGAEDRTIEFTVSNTIYYRVFGESAFVLNPGPAGVLAVQDVKYSNAPQDKDNSEPSPYTLHFGQELFTFHDIDYTFEKPPAQIETKTRNAPKVKKHLYAVYDKPVELLRLMPRDSQPDKLLDLIENFLPIYPKDRDLLRQYVTIASAIDRTQRAVEFLGAGLDRKPIHIDWHRMYQSLCDTGVDDKIVATYDKMLAESPENSELLYLRGRLCAKRSGSEKYFTRAIKADPKNPYPPFAIAYGLISAGQLDKARKHAAAACRLSPDHDSMRSQFMDIRLALKEYDSLITELQARARLDASDIANHTNLLRALIAAGKSAEARQANRRFISRLPKDEYRAVALSGHAKSTLAYLLGEANPAAGLSSKERKVPNLIEQIERIASLESGNRGRITGLLADSKQWENANAQLILGMAWLIAGEQSAASRCFDEAADQFASGGKTDRQTSILLKQGDKLKLGDVDEVSRNMAAQAIVLVALARGNPSNRTALLDRAEKLNVVGGFPHHLIRKAIAALRR
jgi:tetratricopeptide (TPR) repeat protein